MNKMFIGFVIASTFLTVFNNPLTNTTENQKISKNDLSISQSESSNSNSVFVTYGYNTISIKEIVNAYLQLKNALTEDNSAGIAATGKNLTTPFKNFDKSPITTAQKKIYEAVEVDASENMEHIGSNSGNIEYQREHFELLSKDIYNLIKAFGTQQLIILQFIRPKENKSVGILPSDSSNVMYLPDSVHIIFKNALLY